VIIKGNSLVGETSRRGKEENDVHMTEVCYIYMYENNIINPTKYCWKRGGDLRKNKPGWIWSKYITCMYGHITMKPLCTINLHQETK
jgi:hypothetical protein